MAWTSPRTWTTAELVTSTIGNTHWRDNLIDLDTRANLSYNAARALVHNSAALTAQDGVWTAMAMDTEDVKSGITHSTSTNTPRLTIVTAGTYLVRGSLEFVLNDINTRGIGIRKNATTFLTKHFTPIVGLSTNFAIPMSISVLCYLAVNDYVELMAYQNSGTANLTINAVSAYSPYFGAVRVTQ